MQSVVSDLLLTNTIISLLLRDNEVASVLFPLPSGVLRKVVPTAADVTVDRTLRTRVLRSSKGHWVCHRSAKASSRVKHLRWGVMAVRGQPLMMTASEDACQIHQRGFFFFFLNDTYTLSYDSLIDRAGKYNNSEAGFDHRSCCSHVCASPSLHIRLWPQVHRINNAVWQD